MRIIKCLCLIGGLWPMVLQAAAIKPLLDIDTWQTSQGIPVYFIESPAVPMLDVDVVFAAGSQYDGSLPGVANFAASMLSEGSKNHDANAIADQFDANGGQFAATTNRDFTSVSLRSMTAKPYWKNNFANYIEVLSRPAFKVKDMKRLQQQLLTAIKLREQDPSRVAADLFYQTLYKGQPYAHPVQGSAVSIKRITTKKLRQFYQRYFVARNAVITLVGNIGESQAKAIAEEIGSSLALGQHAVPQQHSRSLTQAHFVEKPFNVAQSTVIIGQLGIKPTNQKKAALNVGNFILGGPGLVSELANALRQKRGWVYGVNSQFKTMQAKGPFVISLQTKAKQTQAATRLATNILDKMVMHGPSAKQVAAAKQAIIGSFPLAMSSNAQLSALLTGIAFYQLPLNYYDQYLAKLKAVDVKQVRQAWKQAINPKHLVTVVVGPRARNDNQ